VNQVQSEIRSLTGLRGLAAAWVVLYHFHQADASAGALGTFLRHGYLAVDIFFVLSGFVMALSYTHLFAKGLSVQSFGVFLVRRFARIYPLYILMTCLFALMVVLGYTRATTLSDLPSSFL
jgi:peptidoglycan/LPS O-acetylase OafA/YrhL